VYGRTKYYNADKEELRIEFFNEREVDQILSALRHEGYHVEVYYDESDFIKDVINQHLHDVDNMIVFNLARNGKGISKKSLIPCFCDLMKIKYTGSGAYACSLARNKYHVAKLLQGEYLHGLNSWLFNDGTWVLNARPPQDMEVIIKPLYESASRGIFESNIISTASSNFIHKIEAYYRTIKSPVLVQQFIRGYEAKIPIFVLDKITAFHPVGVQIGESRFLDDKIITEKLSYHYKYENYDLRLMFEDEQLNNIMRAAENVFELLGMENYGRIDCRITEEGEFFFYDFATMPYFTDHSELMFSFQQEGFSRGALFNLIFNSTLISKYNYSV